MALLSAYSFSRLRSILIAIVCVVFLYFYLFPAHPPNNIDKKNLEIEKDSPAKPQNKNLPPVVNNQNSKPVFQNILKKATPSPFPILQLPKLARKTGLEPLKELAQLQKTFWKSGNLIVNLTNVGINYLSWIDPPPKTELCIVSAFEGEYIPDYVHVFIESLARNSEYASLTLFTHTKTTAPESANFPKVDDLPSTTRVFDIATIDPTYRYRGFAGLAADNICKHFNATRQNCDKLESAFSKFQGQGGPLIVQLRGLFPIIFSRWINSDRCNSWAFAAPELIFGDLKRWLDSPKISSADIVTINAGDLGRVYLRKEFVVHNLRTRPEYILNLWKRCSSYSTFESLLKTFEKSSDWQSMVEGCYSAGVLSSESPKLSVMLLPWRLGDVSPNAFQISNKHLTYCVGQGTAEVCRGQLKLDVKKRETAEKQRNLLISQIADSDDEHTVKTLTTKLSKLGRPASLVFTNDTTPKSSTATTGLLQSIELNLLQPNCSHWLPKEEQVCVDQLHKLEAHKFAYIQVVTTGPLDSVTAKLLKYERPADWVDPAMVKGVAETMVALFPETWLREGKEMLLSDANVLEITKKLVKSIGPSLERTWWYTTMNGSILVTEKKIMFHTLQGLW
ncbi:hypothetical protein HK098_002133 [Nowakowskiella sp. JEL0407]|nr:hypothetical protein HK098_002133 [Nowakowskiella sp. JEL0407]